MIRYLKNIDKIRQRIRVAAEYRSILRQVIDIITHKVLINVNPADYYRFEFYRGGKTMDDKSRYVVLGGSRYWPFESNELKYTSTLSNKYIQKSLLLGFGLPTPNWISTIGNTFAIRAQEQLDRFLDAVESDIVIKPISSSSGENVVLYSPGSGAVSAGKRLQNYCEIWSHLDKKMDSGWLVEEKVTNTEKTRAIYPHSLNTYRIITIKTSDDKWHVAACAHKFGSRASVVDNNSQGIQASLDKDGVIFHVYDFVSGVEIESHPDTGVQLIGVKMDGYREVVELALNACRKFGFLGTIGWDVAYTAKGPMVIEGNTSWGCSSIQRGFGGLITDEIARGLRRHHIFSRWDKTRLNPKFF